MIREDGKIQAADPTFASAKGQLTVRFDGTTLVGEASNGDPVALGYGFSMVEPADAGADQCDRDRVVAQAATETAS